MIFASFGGIFAIPPFYVFFLQATRERLRQAPKAGKWGDRVSSLKGDFEGHAAAKVSEFTA
jgi:hypothetical protein